MDQKSLLVGVLAGTCVIFAVVWRDLEKKIMNDQVVAASKPPPPPPISLPLEDKEYFKRDGDKYPDFIYENLGACKTEQDRAKVLDAVSIFRGEHRVPPDQQLLCPGEQVIDLEKKIKNDEVAAAPSPPPRNAGDKGDLFEQQLQQQQLQQQKRQPPRKGNLVFRTIQISLEDLYIGTVKKLRITRKVFDLLGRYTEVTMDKEFIIKPGETMGWSFCLKEGSDVIPDEIPGDIHFRLETRPHSRFTRDGDDLIYIHPVTRKNLPRMKLGLDMSVLSIDNREIPIVTTAITPETKLEVRGEGMPRQYGPGRGNLKIHFFFLD